MLILDFSHPQIYRSIILHDNSITMNPSHCIAWEKGICICIWPDQSRLLISGSGWINSLGPSGAIWRHRSGSILAQVMACWLTAPSHYLLTYQLSSLRSSDIHPTAVSQEMPQPTVTELSLKITYRNFHSNLPGANELVLPWHFHVCEVHLKSLELNV